MSVARVQFVVPALIFLAMSQSFSDAQRAVAPADISGVQAPLADIPHMDLPASIAGSFLSS